MKSTLQIKTTVVIINMYVLITKVLLIIILLVNKQKKFLGFSAFSSVHRSLIQMILS